MSIRRTRLRRNARAEVLIYFGAEQTPACLASLQFPSVMQFPRQATVCLVALITRQLVVATHR